MKIEIDIDIESIVREALKKKQEKEETPKVWTEAIQTKTTTGRYYTAKEKAIAWEFAPRKHHRRTAEERALHVLERKHGRALTPEEKGEAKAIIQIDETTENTIKEAAIKKDRIDKIAAEGMAAASKELAEEIKERNDNITRVQEGMDKHDRIPGTIEATIPETEKLDTNSLFS
jgi:hypothetical protein